MMPDYSGGSARICGVFLFHTMIVPSIGENEGFGNEKYRSISIQHSSVFRGNTLKTLSSALWALLFGYGVWTTLHEKTRFARLLLLVLTGQLLLHLVYGNETFLYSLHFVPLLVTVAAYSTRKLPRASVALALLLAVMQGYHNVQMFGEACQFLVR
jgi:hypothetical protein